MENQDLDRFERVFGFPPTEEITRVDTLIIRRVLTTKIGDVVATRKDFVNAQEGIDRMPVDELLKRRKLLIELHGAFSAKRHELEATVGLAKEAGYSIPEDLAMNLADALVEPAHSTTAEVAQ